MPKRMPRYTVDCADDDYGPNEVPDFRRMGGYFVFDRTYRESEVQRIFDDRIADIKPHIFPGLRLIDEQGQMLKAELCVILTPIPGGEE